MAKSCALGILGLDSNAAYLVSGAILCPPAMDARVATHASSPRVQIRLPTGAAMQPLFNFPLKRRAVRRPQDYILWLRCILPSSSPADPARSDHGV